MKNRWLWIVIGALATIVLARIALRKQDALDPKA